MKKGAPNEAAATTLSRVKKEMARPRATESAKRAEAKLTKPPRTGA